MKCLNCGKEVSGKFCKYCGSGLSQTTEFSVAPKTSQPEEESTVQQEEKVSVSSERSMTYTPLIIGLALLLLVSVCFVTPLGGKLVAYVKNIPVGIRNGCSASTVLDKQEAILQYANADTRELKKLSAELSTILVAMSDNRSEMDAQKWAELADSAVKVAGGQSEVATSVATKISDEEIAGVHQLYINYCQAMSETITLIVKAYESGDAGAMDEANLKAVTANELVNQYDNALKDLAAKYNISVDNVSAK